MLGRGVLTKFYAIGKPELQGVGQSFARHSKSSPATAEATMCFVDISDEAALFFRTFFALWTVISTLRSS